MSVILGINSFHQGASAAVLVNGRPTAAIAEERLNRVKYYARFPRLAIRRCLEMSGLRFRDVDFVAVGRDSQANTAKKLQYALRNPTKLLSLLAMKSARGALDDVRSLIVKECEADPAELRFTQYNVEHHLAHIASAYFVSDWERAAGFSIDESGDFVTCMLADCKDDEIEVRRRVYVPHSLGTLYTTFCQLAGYDKYGDEGKVMGLAPYGKDTYLAQLDDVLRLDDEGFRLDPKYFRPFGDDRGNTIEEDGEVTLFRHYSDLLVRLFGPAREPGAEISQRDMDLAAAAQRIFERGYMHMLRLLHAEVPSECVAMAGGCVLNSVANGKVFDETPFRHTCIQPAAGDEGLALGAALYVSRAIRHERERYVMRNAYLGPEFAEPEIRLELEKRGIPFERAERDALIRLAVERIEKGDVVGWFQGRMEWGPRALGNRSILVHPGLANMKETLNARIKRREWFRPFAPAVLAERQSDVFERAHPSPFMLHVYGIRKEWRERLAAVTHVDGTGRLQTVSPEENALFHDLIAAFEARTGLPVLLNTSFNENEPIVCAPGEAIDCFSRTKMDVLVIGPFICRKSPER